MKFKYAIQCDKLRTNNPDGEIIWSEMMLNAKAIDSIALLEACDLETLVDEGESFEDFTGSDPASGCFHYNGPHGEAYFFQTSGFEFFFTKDGSAPSLSFPTEIPPIMHELARDTMARCMLPPNCALSNGRFQGEDELEWVDANLILIQNGEGLCRFLMLDEGDVIAGMSVENNVVEHLYVAFNRRREGIATELFRAARNVLGHLEHSSRLTDEGVQFVKYEESDTYSF